MSFSELQKILNSYFENLIFKVMNTVVIRKEKHTIVTPI